MKKSIILFIALLSFSISTISAKGIKNTAERVPKISIVQAVDLVKEHHKKSKISEKEIYIDSAILKNNIWEIGYRLKAYESGHRIVTVTMNGTITLNRITKDQ